MTTPVTFKDIGETFRQTFKNYFNLYIDGISDRLEGDPNIGSLYLYRWFSVRV